MKGNTVKITLDEWNSIDKYHPCTAKWSKKLCTHTITRVSYGYLGDVYRREVKVALWFYLIMFIPYCLLNFFALAWDGGLKYYQLPERNFYVSNADIYNSNSEAFETVQELYFQKKGIKFTKGD